MADVVSTLSIAMAVVLGGVLLLWVLHFRLSCRHRTSKSGASLPKGSFGWPVIGESLDFARNPGSYASSHYERYGSINKSCLFLRRAILGTTPDFAKFVTSNSHLFQMDAPANSKRLGPKAFVFKDGPQHMSVKKTLQKALLPESLQSRVEVLENIVLQNLASWEQSGTVMASIATQKITTETAAYILFGVPYICSTPHGRFAVENLKTMSEGQFAVPFNLPGTALWKALKAKEVLMSYLKELLEARRRGENHQNDSLGALLAAKNDPEARPEVKDLDDNSLLENLVGMWIGASETTAVTLTWTLKFLEDHPNICLRVQAEQQEILKNKHYSMDGPRLTWEDTRKMVYTQKFFKELQRIVSIGAIAPRKATQDVEYKGTLIPKGWAVYPMYNFIHLDPSIHPDPLSFNPDRFDAQPKPFTYLPFSSGSHMCPGVELAKLVSLIYIHHLTTTFKFEKATADQGVEYRPFPIPIGGYPVHIHRQN
ncbi:unnamed protein product [Calypogeia fissa]